MIKLSKKFCMGQIGDTLEEFLADATSDPKLRQCLMSLAEATRTIAFKVRADLTRHPHPWCWEMGGVP